MNETNLSKIKEFDDGKKLQKAILQKLSESISDKVYKNKDDFTKVIKKMFDGLKPNLIKAIVIALSEMDKTSDTYPSKKTKSKLEPDGELNESEFIPLKVKVSDYFDKEVKPFVPDAWYEDSDVEDKTAKIGCEINFNKYFYKYIPPVDSDKLLNELRRIVSDERGLLIELGMLSDD